VRFIDYGPDIPDRLLTARDQGRVVFFCGAGVSRARANLPDFFGLARKVLNELKVGKDAAVFKLLLESTRVEKHTGISGLISADHIFTQLKKEYAQLDIEIAVAKALKPANGVDLSAHRTILNLARTEDGKTRLVTTNFDRLFSDCSRKMPIWQYPRLPDPAQPMDFDGIVHLHGIARPDYTGPERNGFVLSTAEFGKAYLAEGWATEFFKNILSRYVVVFLGYSADDPPVRYLLEGFSRSALSAEGLYAFQSGEKGEASERWRLKGVEAISYSDLNSHAGLWDTLSQWAKRAKAPDKWRSSVFNLALKGPRSLSPFQRGQVAHLVSSLEGAKLFAESMRPPSADWLCVFDRERRYARPGRIRGIWEKGPNVDPFEKYGLDSDIPPSKSENADQHERKVPLDAWDALEVNDEERRDKESNSSAAIRGPNSVLPAKLSPRLFHLQNWISQVSTQPAALWWAAHQNGLHPNLLHSIRYRVFREKGGASKNVKQGWRYLLPARDSLTKPYSPDGFELDAIIRAEGWNSLNLRQYGEYAQPTLRVSPSLSFWPLPPVKGEKWSLHNLIKIDVEYQEVLISSDIPSDLLKRYIEILRENLHKGIHLENEIGGYFLDDLVPIIPDTDRESDTHSRGRGLSACVIALANEFERLVTLNPSAAQSEFFAWRVDDNRAFCRLRVWACRFRTIIGPHDVVDVITSLSTESFWNARHQRDLLLSLRERWNDLSEQQKQRIEARILKGPKRWRRETVTDFRERRIHAILERLLWLKDNGCEFTFDVEKQTKSFETQIKQWNPEWAKNAASSLESVSGFIRTDTDPSRVQDQPIHKIIEVAKAASKRDWGSLIEHDPFAGLSKARPIRALAALDREGRGGIFQEWAWRAFLEPENRKDDRPRLALFIARRILSYQSALIAPLIWSIVRCFRSEWEKIRIADLSTFDTLFKKLTVVLGLETTDATSGVVRTDEHIDWVSEAINSPAGYLTEMLSQDPDLLNAKKSERLSPRWTALIDGLFALPGDQPRYAKAILAHRLEWLHHIDPEWTFATLISALSGQVDGDRQAVLAGILWRGQIPNDDQLFFAIKPHLLDLVHDSQIERRGYTESLSGMLLNAWIRTRYKKSRKLLTDQEFNRIILGSNDRLRTTFLWQLDRWSRPGKEAGDGAPGKAKDRAFLRNLLVDLLGDVWPKQLRARSGIVSARLCEIALRDSDSLKLFAPVIIPLLVPSSTEHMHLFGLSKSESTVVSDHPKLVLDVLHPAMPVNTRAWPYNMGQILQDMVDADGSMRLDPRWLELNRRWEQR
jgi:hypothetical protein